MRSSVDRARWNALLGYDLEPVSDIDIVVVDSLKVLDPERPIREADLPDSVIVKSSPLPASFDFVFFCFFHQFRVKAKDKNST